MSYLYKTKGTCSTMIEVELDGHVVKDVNSPAAATVT